MSYKSTVHDGNSRKSDIYQALIENQPVVPSQNAKAMDLHFINNITCNNIHGRLSRYFNENKNKIIILQRQYDDAQYKRDFAYDKSSKVLFVNLIKLTILISNFANAIIKEFI